MPEAADALLDLGSVLVWGVAFALATLAYYIVKPIADALDVSILGVRPFHGIAVAIENGIIGPLNDLRSAADSGIAEGFTGVLASLELVLGLTLLLGDGVKLALQYLWNHALSPFVHSITDAGAADARQALSEVETLTSETARDIGSAVQAAEDFATRSIDTAESALLDVIATAKADAISYADQAVSTLRDGENAINDTLASLFAELEAAKATAAAGIASASAEALSAQEDLQDAVFKPALAQVETIAVTAQDELSDLLGKLSVTDAAAALASVGALSTLVYAIATEAGLGDAACRAKNKQICGVDPAAWTNLLGGLAAVGFAFNLKNLYDVAQPLVGELSGVIAQAA